jgi:hypothetical protein
MKPEMVLRHEFVEVIPDQPHQGVVYVCIRYATVVHRCCCGCGSEVVTPLSPTDWKLIFDGETISLHPSIGNWSFPCQSHYWIRHNRISWAPKWSQEEIAAGRAADGMAKEKYYAGTQAPAAPVSKPPVEHPPEGARRESVWRKLRRWLFG